MSRFIRALSSLEWEERILAGSNFVAGLGVFLPWMSGEWLGSDRMTYNGLGFYTSFLGLGILLVNAYPILALISPLLGGPLLLPRRPLETIRFFLAIQSTILILAALSVLTKVTFEFSRMEVRFGIYCSLIGSLVSALYAFLLFQERRRHQPQEVFQHPEDKTPPPERLESTIPPPPPPPPPLAPEDYQARP